MSNTILNSRNAGEVIPQTKTQTISPSSQSSFNSEMGNFSSYQDSKLLKGPNSTSMSPDKFNKRNNYATYKYDYFSGCQSKVYFGDVWVDDIITIQWSSSQNKTPIYGYASQNFDAVARGTFLLEGSLTIAFKEVGYLNAIMNLLKYQKANKPISTEVIGRDKAGNPLYYTRSGQALAALNVQTRLALGQEDVRAVPDDAGGVININSTPSLIRRSETIEDIFDILQQEQTGPFTNKGKYIDLEDYVELMEDSIWGDSNNKYLQMQGFTTKNKGDQGLRILRPDEFDDNGRGGIAVARDSYAAMSDNILNIMVAFGDLNDLRAEHTMIVLNDVHFRSNGMLVAPNGEPIAEVYNFFARDVNKTVSHNNLLINPIKFNIGLDNDVSPARLKDIEAIRNKLEGGGNNKVSIKILSTLKNKEWTPESSPIDISSVTDRQFNANPSSDFVAGLGKYVTESVRDYLLQDGRRGRPEQLALEVIVNDQPPFIFILTQIGDNTANYIVKAPSSSFESINIVRREDFFKPIEVVNKQAENDPEGPTAVQKQSNKEATQKDTQTNKMFNTDQHDAVLESIEKNIQQQANERLLKERGKTGQELTDIQEYNESILEARGLQKELDSTDDKERIKLLEANSQYSVIADEAGGVLYTEELSKTNIIGARDFGDSTRAERNAEKDKEREWDNQREKIRDLVDENDIYALAALDSSSFFPDIYEEFSTEIQKAKSAILSESMSEPAVVSAPDIDIPNNILNAEYADFAESLSTGIQIGLDKQQETANLKQTAIAMASSNLNQTNYTESYVPISEPVAPSPSIYNENIPLRGDEMIVAAGGVSLLVDKTIQQEAVNNLTSSVNVTGIPIVGKLVQEQFEEYIKVFAETNNPDPLVQFITGRFDKTKSRVIESQLGITGAEAATLVQDVSELRTILENQGAMSESNFTLDAYIDFTNGESSKIYLRSKELADVLTTVESVDPAIRANILAAAGISPAAFDLIAAEGISSIGTEGITFTADAAVVYDKSLSFTRLNILDISVGYPEDVYKLSLIDVDKIDNLIPNISNTTTNSVLTLLTGKSTFTPKETYDSSGDKLPTNTYVLPGITGGNVVDIVKNAAIETAKNVIDTKVIAPAQDILNSGKEQIQKYLNTGEQILQNTKDKVNQIYEQNLGKPVSSPDEASLVPYISDIPEKIEYITNTKCPRTQQPSELSVQQTYDNKHHEARNSHGTDTVSFDSEGVPVAISPISGRAQQFIGPTDKNTYVSIEGIAPSPPPDRPDFPVAGAEIQVRALHTQGSNSYGSYNVTAGDIIGTNINEKNIYPLFEGLHTHWEVYTIDRAIESAPKTNFVKAQTEYLQFLYETGKLSYYTNQQIANR